MGGGGEEGGWQPTFDAQSRNAKIPNSHLQVGEGRGEVGDLSWNFHFLEGGGGRDMECMEFAAAT